MPSRRHRYASALLLILFALGPAVSARAAERTVPQLDALLLDYDLVRIDPVDAARRVGATGQLTVETPRASFELRLEPHDLRAPGYRAQVSHEGGEVEALEPGPVETYRGTVRGLDGAEARFTINPNGVRGLILTDDAWYYVEPERNFAKTADRASHVVYSSSDVRPEAIGRCGVPAVVEAASGLGVPEHHAALQGAEPEPVIELATDADFEYYDHFGTARAANQEITSIINEVEGIYKKQLGLTFWIVFQNVWDTRRDPYEGDDSGDLLNQLRLNWQANYTGVERDIVHLFTGRFFFDTVIGIAYRGVACRALSLSYGLSTRQTSGPGKFILTAHEMGHNLNAIHPDQLSTPITKCDNTIMQSFVGTGFKFCKYSRDEILSWLVNFSACFKNNHLPVAYAGPDRFAGQGDTVLLFAVGSADPDGDALAYLWTQTAGPTVTIANAATATPSFTVPVVAAETRLSFTVSVDDGRGGVVEDSVDVNVLPAPLAGVTVGGPVNGTTLKVGGNLKLQWTSDAELAGALRIELSRDGGATFETLFDNVSSTARKKKWVVTGPKTAAAVVRFTSTADSRSQTYGPTFSIQ